MAAFDGALSTVRRELGIDFVGESEPGRSFSCAARLAPSVPDIDGIHQFLHASGRVVLVHLRGAGRIRVTGSIEPADVGAPLTGEVVERYVWQHAGLRASVEDDHHQTVLAYRIWWGPRRDVRAGVSLPAGDAAHTFPPEGVFGLNRAIADAAAYADLVTRSASQDDHAEAQHPRRMVDRDLLDRSLALRRAALATAAEATGLRQDVSP